MKLLLSTESLTATIWRAEGNRALPSAARFACETLRGRTDVRSHARLRHSQVLFLFSFFFFFFCRFLPFDLNDPVNDPELSEALRESRLPAANWINRETY